MNLNVLKMIFRPLLPVFLLCVITFAAQAQTLTEGTDVRTVKGQVIDEDGESVIGAAVILKGTTKGTTTDFEGNFSINIDRNNAVLVVSEIGYKSKETPLTDIQTQVTIILQKEPIALNESVAVGYGVQNRRDITTSISSMSANELANLPTSDFRDAMAGKMPGVQVTTLGGQPDGNPLIRIRGIQSATSGNDPLYVIDGIPSSGRAFSNIESNDIESIEVLKDASAAAIYGSRGSCGVILITTKRGNSERPVVSYDGQIGISNVSKKMDMLNAYELAELVVEGRNGSYLFEVPTGSIDDPYAGRPQTYHRITPMITEYLMDTTGTLTDTDWQDEIFRTAVTTKHSLSVSGQTSSLKYYIDLSYLYREGIVICSDFQRYSFRANIDGSRKRLKYGISLAPSFSVTNYVNTESQYYDDGVISTALSCPPFFPVYNDDGSYCWDMNGYLRTNVWDIKVTEKLNPVALCKEIDDVRRKTTLVGNAYASYEFIKGLEYKFTAGGEYYNYTRNYYRPSYIPLDEGDMHHMDELSDPTAQNNTETYLHWTISNQLSFNRTFGDHSISAVAVYEAEKETVQASQIVGTGTAGDDKIRTTKGKTISLNNTYDNSYAYTFASWLVRASYSYKNRYLVSASIRGDASSRFAPNSRWGYFPAASVGWRISDEKFMNKAKWIDDLKIRASIGQTGNAQIGNSEYLALYSMSNIDLGNGITPTVYPSQIANNDLSWEKNTQYNVGLDGGFWRGYLGITADYYYTKTTNMLFDVPVSSVSGLTSSEVNIGSMQNTGVELNLTSQHRFGDFSYAVSVNWTLNRNKVLHLGDEDADIIKKAAWTSAYYITRVGYPIGCYYLLKYDGVFHNQEELDSYPHFDTTVAGDFRFIDADGDGIMEADDDRVICGNYAPDFYYGFSINLAWKGFDLQANFQGVYGNELLYSEGHYIYNMEASTSMVRESLKRYPYGEASRVNRQSSGNVLSCVSTFFLQDGSYLRLQSLSLGYTFPDRWFRKANISKFRIYLQGTNVFTLTNYIGYNPEANEQSSDALRPGEDFGGNYPLPRTFTFGVNFNL